MPLKLNVGLSKKVGEANYGSRGASVNVELELDATLATQPDRMRERIREMFGLARNAVEEELHSSHTPSGNQPGNGNGHANGSSPQNGHGQNGDNGSGRSATQSQVRAIHAIARRQRVDLVTLLRERYGCERPDDLSIRDASDLIDEMKNASSPNGAGGRR